MRDCCLREIPTLSQCAWLTGLLCAAGYFRRRRRLSREGIWHVPNLLAAPPPKNNSFCFVGYKPSFSRLQIFTLSVVRTTLSVVKFTLSVVHKTLSVVRTTLSVVRTYFVGCTHYSVAGVVNITLSVVRTTLHTPWWMTDTFLAKNAVFVGY